MMIKGLEMHSYLTTVEMADMRDGKEAESNLKSLDFDVQDSTHDYRDDLPSDLRNALRWIIG
jgi:hypothetical protein